MSVIAFSTVSENPIGVESIASPVSDLKLEVFGVVSKTHIIEDVASLTLSNGIDEVIAPFNVAGILGLTASVNDTTTVVYNQVDNGVLKYDGNETVTTLFKVVDTAPLTLVGFERPLDNVPSEAWREYPGLPIQPIGYSPVSSEQFDITFRTFSDDGEISLDIAVIDEVQIVPSSTDSIALVVEAQDIISSTANYVDQGNLTTVFIVDQVVFLNSSESADLEINAADQVEQQFNFVDTIDIDIAVEQENSLTSIIEDTGNLTTVSIVDQVVFLNSNESVNLEIAAQDQVEQQFNFVDTLHTDIAVEQENSLTSVVDDTGNLTTVSIVDQVVFLNSSESADLEIAAQDQVQQIFEFFEVAEIIIENEDVTSSTLNDTATVELRLSDDIISTVSLDYRDIAGGTIELIATESKTSNYSDDIILFTEPNDFISMRYYSFDTAVTTISAKTFAKEYTFLQQEFAIDQYELRLSAESRESFRSGSGAVIRSRQFWIG